MKRSGALRRLTPMRRVSRKAAALQRRLIDAQKLVYLRSGGRCEARPVLGWCDQYGQHYHHLLRRAHGGKHAVDNIVFICAESHEWIHQHPAKAEALGLLRRSHSRNATVTGDVG